MSPFKKIMMWLGIFAGSGLAFLITVYFAASFFTSGLKTPIEMQLAAIRAGDTELAYTYMSKTFQSSTSLKGFKKLINAYSTLRNNQGISYQQREISNETGIVKATLKSSGGAEMPVRYRLIKVDGQWKIAVIVINPNPEDETIDQRSEMEINSAATKNQKH